jgi:nicotinamidase-related amidase
MSQTIEIPAEPSSFRLAAGKTALIVIDMQRDFLLPGGFGESLGNDVDLLLEVVPPPAELIDAARSAGIMVIHTREGHEPGRSRPRSTSATPDGRTPAVAPTTHWPAA